MNSNRIIFVQLVEGDYGYQDQEEGSLQPQPVKFSMIRCASCKQFMALQSLICRFFSPIILLHGLTGQATILAGVVQ